MTCLIKKSVKLKLLLRCVLTNSASADNMLVSLTGVFTTVAAFITAMAALNASITIHQRLLQNILKCPLKFFESTPQGRLMNRFSSDMSTVDLVVPFTYRSMVNSVIGAVLTLAVIIANIPWVLLAVIVLAAPYFFIQVCLLA